MVLFVDLDPEILEVPALGTLPADDPGNPEVPAPGTLPGKTVDPAVDYYIDYDWS